MNKQFLDSYFRKLRHALLCSRKEKVRILTDLRINAENWLESHPEGNEQSFLTAFGTPEEFAASYMEEMGYSNAHQIITMRKRISKTAFLLAVVALLVVATIATSTLFSGNRQKETISVLPAEYATQIGVPWDQALENLNLTEDELHQSGITMFRVPNTVMLRGCTFDVYLIYDQRSGCLDAFEYYLKNGDPADFIKLYDSMTALYGQPYRAGFTEERLEEMMQSEKPFSLSSTWVTRRYEPHELQQYREAKNKDTIFEYTSPVPYSLIATLLIRRNEKNELSCIRLLFPPFSNLSSPPIPAPSAR